MHLNKLNDLLGNDCKYKYNMIFKSTPAYDLSNRLVILNKLSPNKEKISESLSPTIHRAA